MEPDTKKKGQVYKLLKLKLKLHIEEDKKYKIEVLKNSAVYASNIASKHLPKLYYFIS